MEKLISDRKQTKEEQTKAKNVLINQEQARAQQANPVYKEIEITHYPHKHWYDM